MHQWPTLVIEIAPPFHVQQLSNGSSSFVGFYNRIGRWAGLCNRWDGLHDTGQDLEHRAERLVTLTYLFNRVAQFICLRFTLEQQDELRGKVASVCPIFLKLPKAALLWRKAKAFNNGCWLHR